MARQVLAFYKDRKYIASLRWSPNYKKYRLNTLWEPALYIVGDSLGKENSKNSFKAHYSTLFTTYSELRLFAW